MPESAADGPDASARWPLVRTPAQVALGVVLAGAVVMRARFVEVPLGRDEGVYAYIAWTILQGVPLYTSTVDLQMPGLWILYACVMRVLGVSGVGVHLGLLIANVLSTWFVYCLGRRLVGPRAGVVAAACFASVTLSQRMLGFTANAEHFVMVFALAGLVLLERALERDRGRELFAAGVLLGLGLMMKQHGVFYVAFGGLVVIHSALVDPPPWRSAHLRRALLYGAGALTPFAAACLWFGARGVLSEFVFWSFQYSSTYGFDRGLTDAIRALDMNALPIVPSVVVFLILLAIGLVDRIRALVVSGDGRRSALYLTVFFLLTTACVFPGLVFRNHYFLLLVPAASLLCAAGVEALVRAVRVPARRAGIAAALVAALAIGQLAYAERGYLFRLSPDEIARHSYQLNPIVELREIGAFVREHTEPDDRVAIFGSEPQIYLHAQRRSASTLVVMYPMMWAPPEMALELQYRTIAEVEAARPKILIAVDNSTSWAFETYSDRYILRWLNEYVKQGYELVGLVDVNYPDPSVFVWGLDARHYEARSRSIVRIFQRRDATPAS